MAIPCYIFDIDGTLADCTHRLPHILKEPKDWRAFFAACCDDKPIAHMIQLAVTLSDADQPIIFVSGRSDECADATMAWLAEHVFTAPIYMRRAGDHRPDDIVKVELLKRVLADGYEPIMAFDDRKRVVDAWRKAGIPCAQVAEGEF